MATSRLRRILVAVEPAVLEGALALVLEDGGRNVVVEFHQAGEADRAGPFDAAVVTRDVVADVRADLVVTLPDGADGAGIGVVARGDARREVQVRSREQVVDLLDDFEGALATTRTGRVRSG